ncbi:MULTISPECIES: M20 metallopeptidase family protein [Anaerostipes]|uniref:M20 metallopeptidase family protein n=1 Tax=Anaerostipes TaxID=207244 RepID=UPI001C1E347A|nr:MULTISPECIES: amidohydrolase [Anaerostipes]MCI5622962.1 amidohydrolase [Anaerostipes sp.]MDY2727312.1 amidohydrolase [Anaerostipes faecalis]
MNITEATSKIEKDLIEFRRYLHQCPETAYHEMMTMEYIREHLEEWGISYRILDPSGILAVVGSGKKTIALRADMDALEVMEETGLDFTSRNDGYMHACGHDGHVAILMAAAKILKEHEDELDKKIIFIFQPAEETAQGSRDILETGILKGIDAIYGLHIFSGIEAGKISLEPGPRMAATNWFSIRIEGKSGHAGKPHECVDAVTAAASLIMNLQTIVSRNINPLESAVLTIGKVTAGTARNVVAGEAVLEGTVRTFSKKVEEKMKERIMVMAESAAKMYDTDIMVDYQPSSHPALINDYNIVMEARKKAQEVFKPEEFVHVPAMMLGEDFSNYLEEIDGCFAFVGGGGAYPNHHGKFDFDEKALIQGVKLMLTFAFV